MEKHKNLVITGAKRAGKTTLADHLLSRSSLTYAGFRTTVYQRTSAGPLYQLVDITTGEAAFISRLTAAGIRGVPDSFDDLGVRCLEVALQGAAPVLLMDEIGRFEQNSRLFLQAVTRAFDSSKKVVAVLKKEALPHIEALRMREDTLVIDLDLIDRETAYQIADKWRLTI